VLTSAAALQASCDRLLNSMNQLVDQVPLDHSCSRDADCVATERCGIDVTNQTSANAIAAVYASSTYHSLLTQFDQLGCPPTLVHCTALSASALCEGGQCIGDFRACGMLQGQLLDLHAQYLRGGLTGCSTDADCSLAADADFHCGSLVAVNAAGAQAYSAMTGDPRMSAIHATAARAQCGGQLCPPDFRAAGCINKQCTGL
jgi:hypothetical protein